MTTDKQELPEIKMINLRYSLYGAPNKHPQEDMRDMGISYTYGIPQSIADQWWFMDCKNIPDALPEYITRMEADRDYNELVGHGLDKEMAAVLNLKLSESRPAKAEDNKGEGDEPFYYQLEREIQERENIGVQNKAGWWAIELGVMKDLQKLMKDGGHQEYAQAQAQKGGDSD